MSITFKRATEEDIDIITTLGRKIWFEHYPSIISMEQIHFMLNHRYSPTAIKEGMLKGEQYYLAYNHNTPAALADIEKTDGGYFLHKFYVDVARHRNGIGSLFFNFLLTEIGTGQYIRLQVNRQNYKAINFYFKKGFTIESVGDFDIGGGYFMNDFIMVRKPQ